MMNSYRRGMSIIEITIIVAIVAVLVTIITVSFNKMAGNKALESETNAVVSILNQARSKTLSAEADSQYGVHVESDSLTLFRGGTYTAGDPNNQVTTISPRVTISNISLTGGVTNIVFERLSGDSSASGTITLSLVSSPSTQRTVSVSLTGVIQSN